MLRFAIFFRLGLLQEPIYNGEYRRVNDLGFYACNVSHISKFDYVISGLTVGTSEDISSSKLKTKTYRKAVKDPTMFCFILLVLVSGDVAENPAPVKNPCGKCERPVRSNQRGIQCEDRMFGHHIKCIGMNVGEYNSLSISTDSWLCKNCILPNFTDSYFETNNKTTSDSESNTPEFDYVLVRVLPTISKFYERTIFDQLMEFLNNHFNPLLSAFRSGFGCQTALLRLIEDWQKAVDDNKFIAAILMDLSKAFDCLPRHLLMFKLETYGLSENSLKLLKTYLENKDNALKVIITTVNGIH
jgi:hypothetical protein